MGRPIYVLPRQDHVVHLQAHMAFLKSPVFGANPVIVKTFLFPMVTHLRDHLLNYYLTEAHEGVKLASEKEMIGKDANEELGIMLKVQHLIEQELGQCAQMLPEIDKEAQKYAPPQPPQDPSMAVAQLNAQNQDKALQATMQANQAKLAADQAKSAQVAQLGQAKLQLDAAKLQQGDKQAQQKAMADLQKTQMQEDNENKRSQFETMARAAMNDADNETAMRLAAAEIESGEKFAVSTGTGINPQP
jgi:hypothetical protein